MASSFFFYSVLWEQNKNRSEDNNLKSSSATGPSKATVPCPQSLLHGRSNLMPCLLRPRTQIIKADRWIWFQSSRGMGSLTNLNMAWLKKDKRICQLAIKQKLTNVAWRWIWSISEPKPFAWRSPEESGAILRKCQREAHWGKPSLVVTVTTGLGVKSCRPLLS